MKTVNGGNIEINRGYIFRDAISQGMISENEFPTGRSIYSSFNAIKLQFSSFINNVMGINNLQDKFVGHIQNILQALHEATIKEISHVIQEELSRSPEVVLNEDQISYRDDYKDTLEKHINLHFPIKPSGESFEKYKDMIIKKIIKARFEKHKVNGEQVDIYEGNEEFEGEFLGEITRNTILPTFQRHYGKYINEEPAAVTDFYLWMAGEDIKSLEDSGNLLRINVSQNLWSEFFNLNWACQFSWPPAQLSGIGSNFSIKSLPRRLDSTGKNPYGLIVVEGNDVDFLNIEDVNKPKYLKYHEVELSVLFPQLVFLSLDKPPVVVNEGYVLWRIGSNKQLQQESASSATAAAHPTTKAVPAPADVHGKAISTEAEIEEDTTSDSDPTKVQEDLSPDVKIEIQKTLKKLDLVLGDLLVNNCSDGDLKQKVKELKRHTIKFIYHIDKNNYSSYKQHCEVLLNAHKYSDNLNNDTIWGAIYQTFRWLFNILDICITRSLSLKSMEETYTPVAPSLLGRNHFFGLSARSALKAFEDSLEILKNQFPGEQDDKNNIV